MGKGIKRSVTIAFTRREGVKVMENRIKPPL
jgi:hypothetical protein